MNESKNSQKIYIRADLHVHSKFSYDCNLDFETIVDKALSRQIGCVAITDHDEIDGALKMATSSLPIRVIVGEEIRTSEGEIIGLFLKEHIQPGLSIMKTIEHIKEQDGVVYVPHPFDGVRNSTITEEALRMILPMVDVIEVFNYRNLFASYNSKALEFAKTHALAQGAGSDAHFAFEIGKCYVEMPSFETKQEFLENIQRGKVYGRSSFLPARVVMKAYRKVSKIFGKQREKR